MEKNGYYIGLDMGTNSVGWAVTDCNYKLQRAKGKDMWGSLLFSEAQTAEKRRSYRIGRRRRQREVARINYLKMCFAPEIEKIDSGFILRLEESKFHLEDRSEGNKQKYAFFNDKDFTDKEYFEKYPTIFHLRADLLKSNPIITHDVRLVYLALLNMFHHRGNFLNESLSSDTKEITIEDAYKSLVETSEYFDISFPGMIDYKELESILGSRNIGKKEKMEKLSKMFDITKKSNAKAYELLQLCCGMKGKLANIFGSVIEDENSKYSFAFSDFNNEEKIAEILDIIGDEYFELLLSAKAVYDIGLLANILKGEQYISVARLNDYKNHHEDLVLLKQILKEYDKDAYESFFREMKDGNYSAYVGSVNSRIEKVRRNGGKGREKDDLYKTVKGIIAKLPKEVQENDPRIAVILEKIETENFLNKQLTGANGVIPNQVHAKEMKKILENASTYLPFLNEKDDSGLTTSERILAMFTFHLPYYIGPLGQEYVGKSGYNVWARRKAPGKIYPWNIDEKIDIDKAAEDFINRMLRKCTYLQNYKALPKQSLLYEKFMVLNELNNLRIYGEKISVDQKQDIFKTLFMKGKKVKQNDLVKCLIANGMMKKDDSPDVVISGIDGDFKSSLSSLNKFEPIFGKENVYGKNRNMIEKIIYWGTVFGNDRKFIRKKLSEEYGNILNKEQIKRISGYSFTGWGNLSREFLEMPGTMGTDEAEKSIIIYMWESNENLMELLSSSHTFKAEIDKQIINKNKELLEWSIEDLDDMYLSPSVKRMVWQTMRILKDIYKAKGKAPDRIFVEMPREEGEKGKRTISRKKKLEELYKGQKDVLNELSNYEERDFKQRKLYLYYLQNCKSMYTGKEIDLENLLSNNSDYDIDHIYPRHYIKDDSLDNNLVLVEKKINNFDKLGDYPIDFKIRNKMTPFWKGLLSKGFITKEKYNRLTRDSEFTEQEQADFISRQLVETRQGTKAITQILKQVFPESTIVFSKPAVVSMFRQKFNLPKVRCLNSCHHAHDAYLNVVTGNTYYVKFTNNPLNFIKEAGKQWKNPEYKYHMEKIFDHNIERNGEKAWEPHIAGTIKIVKSMMAKTSANITFRPTMKYGGIVRETQPCSAAVIEGKEMKYHPLKRSDDRLLNVSRYGGYKSIANTAYALVEYLETGKRGEGKKVRALVGVPVYLGNLAKDKLAAYVENKITSEKPQKKIKDLSIRIYPVKTDSIIILDGYRYLLGGASDGYIYLKDFVPLYLSSSMQSYLKKVEKALSKDDFSEKKDNQSVLTSHQNIALYDELITKLEKTVYKNKKCNIFKILSSGKGIFESLCIKDQCYLIMQIIFWFNTTQPTVDLLLLKECGGSKSAGKLRIRREITDYDEVILINCSPTGLWEKKVDLLKV